MLAELCWNSIIVQLLLYLILPAPAFFYGCWSLINRVHPKFWVSPWGNPIYNILPLSGQMRFPFYTPWLSPFNHPFPIIHLWLFSNITYHGCFLNGCLRTCGRPCFPNWQLQHFNPTCSSRNWPLPIKRKNLFLLLLKPGWALWVPWWIEWMMLCSFWG